MKNILPTLALLLLLPVACKKNNEIVTYRLAKDTPAATAPISTSAAAPRDIDWTAPTGWKEQAPSAMRAGSFLIIGTNGARAEVSIIPLSGSAGGDLANVNRWRDQLGLPPLTDATLSRVMTTRTLGNHNVRLVSFTNGEKRMMAAILPQGNRTWFFKMTGEDQTVRKSEENFFSFIKSVRFK